MQKDIVPKLKEMVADGDKDVAYFAKVVLDSV